MVRTISYLFPSFNIPSPHHNKQHVFIKWKKGWGRAEQNPVFCPWKLFDYSNFFKLLKYQVSEYKNNLSGYRIKQ